MIYHNNKKLYLESDIFKELPDNILNDNYKLYLILNELASLAQINIGTQRLRLRKVKCDFLLKDINL